MKLTTNHSIRDLVRALLRPLRKVLAPTPIEVMFSWSGRFAVFALCLNGHLPYVDAVRAEG